MEYERFRKGIARLSWVLGVALAIVVGYIAHHEWELTDFNQIMFMLVTVGLVRGLGALVAWIVKGFTKQPNLLEHREPTGHESKD